MPAALHVDALAEEAGVSVTYVASHADAEAFRACRAVRIPLVRSGADYLIALHELGHVLAPGIRRYDRPGVFAELASEGVAWAWALEHARPEFYAPEDLDVAIAAWSSHVRASRASSHEGSRLAVSHSLAARYSA